MHSILRWVKGFLKKNTEDHLGAYASQAAFFIVLSAFPFCIFLLTLLRYSPLTYEDLLNILQMLSPKMANDVIRLVMKEVYEQSTIAITSFTIILFSGRQDEGFCPLPGELTRFIISMKHEIIFISVSFQQFIHCGWL